MFQPWRLLQSEASEEGREGENKQWRDEGGRRVEGGGRLYWWSSRFFTTPRAVRNVGPDLNTLSPPTPTPRLFNC